MFSFSSKELAKQGKESNGKDANGEHFINNICWIAKVFLNEYES